MKTTLKALLISTALLATVAGSAGFAAPDFMVQIAATRTSPLDLKSMEGKRVLGKSRELLGYVGKVDEQAKTVELKTPSGAIVSLPSDVLIEDNDALAAPSLSRGDIIAMIDRPGQAPTIREVGTTYTP
jgi:hypothetical protein